MSRTTDSKTPVTLPGTESWALESRLFPYTYGISVSIPDCAAPPEGFPVLYVLDGTSYFTIARDIVRLQSGNVPKTHVPSAIVVGIGHTGEAAAISKRRFFDFTPADDTYRYPDRLTDKQKDLGPHGNAEPFLACLEQELLPEIARRYPVNPDRQVLFGHSLGGLFALYALFKRPGLFRGYAACSPSFWWNGHDILTYEERFFQNADLTETVLLFTAVGGEEGFMVEDAVRFSKRLESEPIAGLQSAFEIAQSENHASVVPSIFSKAVRFCFAEQADE